MIQQREGENDFVKKAITSKKAGHNRRPPQQTYTIEDQGCSWATPLKKCLSAVLIRPPIVWEIRHFEISKRMELRK